ncbi:uncharacterized protein Bfra_001242 [Botrytis fragariae]|uniref:Uncharacterized protein n=1 Tax=Botrytis fragariae TaxID=1964551 RepID=A0A8H6ELR2_9HELO|nr:uncharacterized protein Bfra_001242 [Botrytis fragariae]KAF5876887.1 hypothetical protein Bfra_001242 [Botrytis fragariae]
MGRKNQKIAWKSKPKPQRATPGEIRASKEAEEKRVQSAAAEATAIQPVSGVNKIGKEGTRDDNAKMRRSGVDLGALAPIPDHQQSFRRLHLALRRRAADARRKEARREMRREKCAVIVEERGGDGGDFGEEEEEEEEEMTVSFFGGGDWRDDKDKDNGGGGAALGGMHRDQTMMV